MRVLFYKSLTYFNVKAPVDYRTTFRSEVEQFTDSISRSVVVIRALRILITFKGAAGADWNAFVFGLIQCNNQRWLLDGAWHCSIRQLSFLKPLHFCQRSFEERFQDNDRHDNKECGRRFHRCSCKFYVCYYNTTRQIPLRSAAYNLMAWFKICRFDSHLTKTKHYSLTWFSNYAIFQAICNCATAKSNTFFAQFCSRLLSPWFWIPILFISGVRFDLYNCYFKLFTFELSAKKWKCQTTDRTPDSLRQSPQED